MALSFIGNLLARKRPGMDDGNTTEQGLQATQAQTGANAPQPQAATQGSTNAARTDGRSGPSGMGADHYAQALSDAPDTSPAGGLSLGAARMGAPAPQPHQIPAQQAMAAPGSIALNQEGPQRNLARMNTPGSAIQQEDMTGINQRVADSRQHYFDVRQQGLDQEAEKIRAGIGNLQDPRAAADAEIAKHGIGWRLGQAGLGILKGFAQGGIRGAVAGGISGATGDTRRAQVEQQVTGNNARQQQMAKDRLGVLKEQGDELKDERSGSQADERNRLYGMLDESKAHYNDAMADSAMMKAQAAEAHARAVEQHSNDQMEIARARMDADRARADADRASREKIAEGRNQTQLTLVDKRADYGAFDHPGRGGGPAGPNQDEASVFSDANIRSRATQIAHQRMTANQPANAVQSKYGTLSASGAPEGGRPSDARDKQRIESQFSDPRALRAIQDQYYEEARQQLLRENPVAAAKPKGKR